VKTVGERRGGEQKPDRKLGHAAAGHASSGHLIALKTQAESVFPCRDVLAGIGCHGLSDHIQ
jgi:hypothetical protein